MCGIGGFQAVRDSQPATEALLAGLAHRGPDGPWAREVAGWSLVQTRLAVIDLSDRVRYPMTDEDERLYLVFNGEIYNHRSLRADLEARGHCFATDCDAEVVLHGYQEWGDEVLGRLQGMWAIAIVDSITGELLIARDPLGIKPLVRTTRGPFAFASDAMALVRAGLASGEPDPQAVDEFLAFHYVPEPRTGVLGLEQVPPGTLLRRRRDGSEESHRFCPPVFAPGRPTAVVDLDEADRIVAGAVERQLAADVDVGIFLSGGVDSALVLSYAVDAGSRPTAFTIGFAGSGDYDESNAASTLAARLGVPHEVEMLQVGFEDAIDGLGRAYDTPFADSSAIATMALARLARRHVKVALSGTGGDDLFAGYYRHRAHRLARALRLLPDPVRERLVAAPSGRGGERHSLATLARSYTARLAAAGAGRGVDYLALVGAGTSPAGLAMATLPTNLPSLRAQVGRRHGLDLDPPIDLDAIQRFEMTTYLVSDLLVKEDRATMAYGLEGRVPLLDDEVQALAARTPDRQRATILRGKILLRELANRRLPGRRGRKRGFAVPLKELFEGEWRDPAREWLVSGDSQLVDRAGAARLVGRADVPAADVWALCALCAWEERLSKEREAAAGQGLHASIPSLAQTPDSGLEA